MVYRDRFEILAKRFFTIENETTTERRREDDDGQESEWSWAWNAALTIGAVAGTALFAWGVYSLLSSDPDFDPFSDLGEKDKKTMRQPGRKGQFMYRDVFEENPKGYFLGLRAEKKNNKK
ncbi:hypothetical protein ACLOJK_038153 [Asimina triloba]